MRRLAPLPALAALAAAVPTLPAARLEPVAHAQGQTQKPSPKAEQEARDHVRKGAEALRSRRFDDAMREFEAGYALLPRPGFILNMAYVQQQAGNLARARGYFRRYLDLDPGSAQRAEVEKAIAEIDAALASAPRSSREPAATSPAAGPPRAPVAVAAAVDDSEVPANLKGASQAPVLKQEPPPSPSASDGQSPFYTRWWFWGTAAGVAVLGVAGILLLRPRGAGYAETGTWGTLGP